MLTLGGMTSACAGEFISVSDGIVDSGSGACH